LVLFGEKRVGCLQDDSVKGEGPTKFDLAMESGGMKTKKTSDGEGFTHREMVSSLFNTRCEVQLKARKGIQQVQIQFDITVHRFQGV